MSRVVHKLLGNLTAGLKHVMSAAVHNRSGVKSRGRLHQIQQVPAVGTEVKNLVFRTSNRVHNLGILNIALNIYCRLETGFMKMKFK